MIWNQLELTENYAQSYISLYVFICSLRQILILKIVQLWDNIPGHA